MTKLIILYTLFAAGMIWAFSPIWLKWLPKEKRCEDCKRLALSKKNVTGGFIYVGNICRLAFLTDETPCTDYHCKLWKFWRPK